MYLGDFPVLYIFIETKRSIENQLQFIKTKNGGDFTYFQPTFPLPIGSFILFKVWYNSTAQAGGYTTNIWLYSHLRSTSTMVLSSLSTGMLKAKILIWSNWYLGSSSILCLSKRTRRIESLLTSLMLWSSINSSSSWSPYNAQRASTICW